MSDVIQFPKTPLEIRTKEYVLLEDYNALVDKYNCLGMAFDRIVEDKQRMSEYADIMEQEVEKYKKRIKQLEKRLFWWRFRDER